MVAGTRRSRSYSIKDEQATSVAELLMKTDLHVLGYNLTQKQMKKNTKLLKRQIAMVRLATANGLAVACAHPNRPPYPEAHKGMQPLVQATPCELAMPKKPHDKTPLPTATFIWRMDATPVGVPLVY